jgi:two-component sensor histidine kinase
MAASQTNMTPETSTDPQRGYGKQSGTKPSIDPLLTLTGRPRLGLLAGLLLFSLGLSFHMVLGPLGEGLGPMTFLPAILISGVFGGIWIGLSVAALCMIVSWFWFLPPYASFSAAPREITTLVVFVFTAAFELFVIQVLKISMNNLDDEKARAKILFRELQHRVANNLQFVASLLRLEKGAVGVNSPALIAIEAAQTRLNLMSQVHRRLHSPETFDQVIGVHLEALCTDLIKASDASQVRLLVAAEPIDFDLDSLMSVSLIVAELVTNSLKHGLVGRADGKIEVTLRERGGICTLVVSDNGSGVQGRLPNGGPSGLGQGILQSLAAQLRGTLIFKDNGGTEASLSFPLGK